MEKMLTVEKIFSPGNAITIQFSESVGSVQTFTATVTALTEEGLSITIKEIELITSLAPGAEITIIYESIEGKKYLFNTYKITEVSDRSPVHILARPWQFNQALLRKYFYNSKDSSGRVHFASFRRFFRIKVELPFYYRLDGVVYIGQVIDLSISGLFAVINPDLKLQIGNQLTFRLKLPLSEFFELTGEIVRSETIDRTKLGVGINFLNLAVEIREEILKYLLQYKYDAS